MAKTGTVKATWPPHKRPLPSDVYGPLPNPNIPWAKKAKSPYSRKGPAPA